MHLASTNDATLDDRLESESLSAETPCALAECGAGEGDASGADDVRSSSIDSPDQPGGEPSWLGKLLGQGALSILDQGVVSGANFLTNVLLFRTLGETAFGGYVSLQNGLLLLRGIQDQLISAPYLLYAQRHRGEDLARYTGSMVLQQIVAAIVAAIVLAGVSGAAFGGWIAGSLAWPALMLMVAGPLMLSREFVRQVSFARLDIGGALRMNGYASALQLIGLALLVLSDRVSIEGVFVLLGFAALLGLVIWSVNRPPIEVSLKASVNDFADNWTFSRWTLASHALGSTMPLITPWILAAVKGFSATGFLAACATLVGVANSFVIGMCNYLCPRAAKAFQEEGVAGLQRVLGIAALLFGVALGAFTLAAWLGGDWLAAQIFGREIPGGGLLLTLLAGGVLANGIGMTAGNGLWAIERPQGNFAADALQCLATIVATVLLVPGWGETGAAIALLVGTTAGTFVRWATLLWLLREGDFAPQKGSRS